MNQDDIIAPELEPAIDIEAEKSDELKETENEAIQEEKHIASVVDHKGWQVLLSEIDKDIKSFSDITQVTSIKDIQELAVVARSNATIAEYLRSFKRRVENAAETRK